MRVNVILCVCSWISDIVCLFPANACVSQGANIATLFGAISVKPFFVSSLQTFSTLTHLTSTYTCDCMLPDLDPILMPLHLVQRLIWLRFFGIFPFKSLYNFYSLQHWPFPKGPFTSVLSEFSLLIFGNGTSSSGFAADTTAEFAAKALETPDVAAEISRAPMTVQLAPHICSRL